MAVWLVLQLSGCRRHSGPDEIIVYCGVDEPVASKIFDQFEKQTGLHVSVRYDIESSKSIQLAGKIEAEKDHPQADVYWSSEPFQNARLADEGLLEAYVPGSAADILPQFKDPGHFWTGTALRARVLAVGVGSRAPPFVIKSIGDMADPRLDGDVVMSRPTSGATIAHVTALYVVWGPEKSREFFRKLRANHVKLVGGNAEVANQVGDGNYALGLTDNDDITNKRAEGGKMTMVIPDQSGMGTLALPTTVGLVKGAPHAEAAKKLIDFLAGAQTERSLIDQKFARWSVRAGAGDSIRAMDVDYRAAVRIYAQAQRESTEILDGREP